MIVIQKQAQGRSASAVAVDVGSDRSQVLAALLQVGLCVIELLNGLLGCGGAQIALFACGEQRFLGLSSLGLNALQFSAAGSKRSFDARNHRVSRSLVLLSFLNFCLRRQCGRTWCGGDSHRRRE
ncbi:MAG TPA: hypothetical protein DHV61_02385 [Glutamicibacter sp.]|nr:hypothetical protein [Glutamicibacter sp.]